MNNLNGLTTVNIELTSRCNKNCWMCGRRKIERDYPELANYGDMKFDLVEKIAEQLPKGIVVQFHNNGEPLLYPYLMSALSLFPHQIACLNTNAKLLKEKAKEIIDNLDSLTISVIERDVEAEEQYNIVKEFLELKGASRPMMIYRLLGDVENSQRWYKLPGIVVNRMLHSPMGSHNYTKKTIIPEIGICLEMLNHLVISQNGDVSICVRFDPERKLVIGNLNNESLVDIWNSKKRLYYKKQHIEGNRKALPICSKCEYWGCPKG